MKKFFNKEYLTEELELPWEALENRIIGTSKWSALHEIILNQKGSIGELIILAD